MKYNLHIGFKWLRELNYIPIIKTFLLLKLENFTQKEIGYNECTALNPRTILFLVVSDWLLLMFYCHFHISLSHIYIIMRNQPAVPKFISVRGWPEDGGADTNSRHDCKFNSLSIVLWALHYYVKSVNMLAVMIFTAKLCRFRSFPA